MVDRIFSGRSSTSKTSSNSRRTSVSSNQLDQDYRNGLEEKYVDDGFEVRTSSGTNHQQPGSHLSVDTRLSELNLGSEEFSLATESASYILSGSSYATTPGSKKTSPNRVQANKPNYYITTPFKQGPHKSKKGPFEVVDPSHELKQVTREKIERVKQKFRRPQPPKGPITAYQRLRKARLQTTGRPISGSGPSIRQCQGILAGPRVVYRSQRPYVYFKEDLSHFGSPSTHPDSPNEMLRADSSIHCTSRASSETGYTDQDCLSGGTDSIDNGIIDSWVRQTHIQEDDSELSSADQDGFQNENIKCGEAHNDDENLEENPVGVSCSDCKNNFLAQSGPCNDILGEEEVAASEISLDELPLPPEVHAEHNPNRNISEPEENSSESKINENKSKHGGCKPFSTDYNNHDSDNDSDDNDLSYKSNHGNKASSYGNSTSGPNERSGGDIQERGKHEGSQRNIGCSGETRSDSAGKGRKLKSGLVDSKGEEVSLTTESAHASLLRNTRDSSKGDTFVDTCVGDNAPLMTVRVRRRTEKEFPTTAKESEMPRIQSNCSRPMSNINLECLDEEDDFLDSDSLDSDRIPSAEIWRNLDKFNLSMSACDGGIEQSENFTAKAQKIQSTGPRRTRTALNRNLKNSICSRPASAPQKPNKGIFRTEKADKGDVLRKYLSLEGDRFAANLRATLPGYFTEQYNILQQNVAGFLDKADLNNQTTKAKHKAIEKNDDSKSEEESKTGKYTNFGNLKSEISEYRRSVSRVAHLSDHDPSGFGVFFTSDLKESCGGGDVTSTSGADTMSQMTERTCDNESCHEFSDDTGFETVCGSGEEKQSQMDFNNDKNTSLMPGEYSKSQDLEKELEGDLEVIANAKLLNETRSSNHKDQPASLAPVSFTINAKPPPGYLFYFAYGADMNINRMSIYLRREHKRLWGILFGFKLRFNKRGSSRDAGGFANVELSPRCSVEGCVYTITDAELAMLDNCMGYPKHYTRAVVPVWMTNCYQPNQLGVAQYCVPALLYVAEQDWIEPGSADTLDYSYSLGQCLKAADILTPNYLQYLHQLGESDENK